MTIDYSVNLTAIPAVGAYDDMVARGQGLYTQAQKAAAGDFGAASSLAEQGVAILPSGGASDVAKALLTMATSTAAGAAMGGPVGALVGAGVGFVEGLSQISTTPTRTDTRSKADLAILARVRAWGILAAQSIGSSDLDNDQQVKPMGWQLYDFVSQTFHPKGSAPVCTPYLWNSSPNDFAGCNVSTGTFGGPPPAQNIMLHLLADASPPSVDPNVAISRAHQIDPSFYACANVFWLGHNSDGSAELELGNHELLLTLACVFGMLQYGASDSAIASELTIQQHIRADQDANPSNGLPPYSNAPGSMYGMIGFAGISPPPGGSNGPLLTGHMRALALLDHFIALSTPVPAATEALLANPTMHTAHVVTQAAQPFPIDLAGWEYRYLGAP